jgi:hypothetical protein
MSAWWQSVLSIVFGVLAVAVLGGGFGVGFACSIRGSPSKGYQVVAISVAIGIPLGGVAFAIYLRELWPIPFMIGAAAFMALPMWLMSRFTRL